MKNKYLDDVKKALGEYNFYKGKIEILQERLNDLEQDDGINSIRYDGISVNGAYKKGSVVERVAEHNIPKKQMLEKEIQIYKRYLRDIDLALKSLKAFRATVVRMKYVEKKDWFEVAEILGYSDVHCRKEATKAIKQLASQLVGEESFIDLPLFAYIYSKKQ